MKQSWYRDPVVLAVALPTLVLHLALVNRYDLFRDELYFIVCGQHPSFGYVDQPPLIPLLAAGLYALGHHVWLLRLPAVFAAVAVVVITVRFARQLGGGDAAAATAGIAVAIAPLSLGMANTLHTTIFEPVAWTLIAFALARALIFDDRRAMIWGGIAGGVALEAKYALVSWLIALAIGLLLTPERRIFARRELWLGVGITIVIAVPSIAWQAAHGWPFAELAHAAADKNASVSLPAFLINQVVVWNPFFAPIWLTGILAPFALRGLAPLRFLSIAFVVVTALIYVTHGKDYYIAAAYPSMFTIGSIAFERAVRSVAARMAYILLAASFSALVAPIATPLLSPEGMHAYMQRLHVAPQQQESSFAGTSLPQQFADQLGWHDFVREVGRAYDALSPAERAKTAIVVDNYGEAAALDLYGAPYHLPPALAGHNQFYLWGLRGQSPRNVLLVQRNVDRLRPYCDDLRMLGATFSPWAMSHENGKSIAFCSGLRASLSSLWPGLKNFS
jgi:Dolichyl-phosphate-mannose-protein mannosyltransferase